MKRFISLVVAAAAVAGCGSAQSTHHDATGRLVHEGPIPRGPDGLPIDARRMDERVESWRRVHRYVLRPNERCLTGAMDLYIPAASTRWARAIRFRLYSPRDQTFHVDLRDQPQVRTWISSTSWNTTVEDHTRAMRDQSACVSQTVAIGTPGSASGTPGAEGVVAVGIASSSPPPPASSRDRTRNRARTTTTRRTPRAPTVTAVAVAPTPPPAPEIVPVDAEHTLSGFVDLGDQPSPSGLHWFNTEFVIESQFANIPMNDSNRDWVIRDVADHPLYLRVWTQEPQDLDGVVIEIEDVTLEPHIPEAEYARLMARRVAAGQRRQEEFTTLCREHPEDRSCYFTPQNRRNYVTADRPPPPPRNETQPRRPSEDHVWIGGAWQWDGHDYVWIAGMWRFVPPAIVATAAGSTETTTLPTSPAASNNTTSATATTTTATTTDVEPARTNTVTTTPVAPARTNTTVATMPVEPGRTNATATVTTPPAPVATVTVAAPAPAVVMPTAAPAAPPPRVESIPPAPQAGAMWIAGYWSWSGTAWVWTSGHWQMPPSAQVRWTPPAVQVNPGGVQVFMPGGWIRLGR